MDMSHAPMVQSRQPFDLQADGKHGPGTADREGLQRVEALGHRPS